MRFTFDKATRQGVDDSGVYRVTARRGDRFGSTLQIEAVGHPALEVWARQTERSPHAGDSNLPLGSDVGALVVWVVDNRAGAGVPLLTLADRVGGHTLGEILHGFLLAYTAALIPGWCPETRPLKVECRGNQRLMMEQRYGP